MARSYDNKTYNECKRYFIMDGKTPRQIAKLFNGKPSPQTLTLWANEKDQDGKTWHDLKVDQRDKEYEIVSPQNMAAKILGRIYELLASPDFNEKTADALAKLQAAMNRISEPKYQLPTMYHMLTQLINFLAVNYPGLLTPEIKTALQDFKNHLRGELLS